jgi:hypothetical protein
VKLGASLLLSLACTIVAAPALAALDEERPFSRVALLLPACEEPGLAASELRAAFALDLRDQGLALAPIGELVPASDVLVSLESRCQGSSELTIHADFASERQSRRVELAEVPTGERARALALALAELLALMGESATPVDGAAPTPVDGAAPTPVDGAAPAVASDSAVASAPSPAPESRRPPAPAPARQARSSRTAAQQVDVPEASSHAERPWRLSLAPELRIFRTTQLAGGRALLRHGRWGVGFDILAASASVSAGSVRTLTPHVSVLYAWPVWGSRDAGLWELGSRIGAGRTFMSATSSALGRASSAEDVYVDAAAITGYSLRVGNRWRVGLAAELGYAQGPIGYADNQEIARTSGPFAALLADVAWLW